MHTVLGIGASQGGGGEGGLPSKWNLKVLLKKWKEVFENLRILVCFWNELNQSKKTWKITVFTLNCKNILGLNLFNFLRA